MHPMASRGARQYPPTTHTQLWFPTATKKTSSMTGCRRMLKVEAMKKPVGSSWTQESWHHVTSPAPVKQYDAGSAIKLFLIKSSEHGMESSNPHNHEM